MRGKSLAAVFILVFTLQLFLYVPTQCENSRLGFAQLKLFEGRNAPALPNGMELFFQQLGDDWQALGYESWKLDWGIHSKDGMSSQISGCSPRFSRDLPQKPGKAMRDEMAGFPNLSRSGVTFRFVIASVASADASVGPESWSA